MADIRIEKKPPVWPWIIAALIIVGLLVYFFVIRDDTGGDLRTGQFECSPDTHLTSESIQAPVLHDESTLDDHPSFIH